MSDWIWALILLLPAGALRLLAHEASHAVAVVVTGGRVDAFRPWPHRGPDGRRYWGAVYRTGGNDLAIAIAPLTRATLGAIIWHLLALTWTPLLVFAWWELTDVVWWWIGWLCRPESDGGTAREILKEGLK
jgi:hypothetical protein